MATVALVTDLIFSTKITGTGRAVGQPVLVARSVDKLREQLAAAGPGALVIIDLNANGVDVLEAIRAARQSGGRVLAYLSHVQAELVAAAREAGADQVLARSAFSDQLPNLLAGAGRET